MLDLIVALTVIVSAVVGLARGAVRELVSVMALILAVLIAVFSLRYTLPITLKALHILWAAEGAALIIVFIAAFILLRVLSSGVVKAIRGVPVVGTVDRVIGLGFGLVRALLLLGFLNLLFTVATPVGRTPPWVTEARLYPVTEAGATLLKALGPKGYAVAGKVAPELSKAVKGAARDSLQDNDGNEGYEAPTRKMQTDLERSR